jgi:hypothetical protein
MEIRTETTNGITKYFVNGKEYNRLEDVPEEFRSRFIDANNNGIPDQMDDLFDAFNGNKEGSRVTNVVKALFNTVKSSEAMQMTNEPEMKKAEGNSYNRSARINEVNPGTPAWVKLLFVIFIGLLAAWAYLKYSGTDLLTKDETPADSTRQLTETIDGVPLTVTPTESNDEQVMAATANVFFITRKQHVEVYDGETLLFSFPLPYGAAISNSNEHKSQLNLSYPVQEGTNLSSKDFSFTINEGACVPEEDESVTWSNKQIGDIEFVIGSGGGAGAGQYYQTENYSFERYGYCMTFTLELHSSNIGNIDPPVSQFDVGAEINFIEDILKSIAFK